MIQTVCKEAKMKRENYTCAQLSVLLKSKLTCFLLPSSGFSEVPLLGKW